MNSHVGSPTGKTPVFQRRLPASVMSVMPGMPFATPRPPLSRNDIGLILEEALKIVETHGSLFEDVGPVILSANDVDQQ
jgi:hypothetical protein